MYKEYSFYCKACNSKYIIKVDEIRTIKHCVCPFCGLKNQTIKHDNQVQPISEVKSTDSVKKDLCIDCMQRKECLFTYEHRITCESYRPGPTKQSDYWPTSMGGPYGHGYSRQQLRKK